ncbi:MAG TPA: hypothetical protein VFX97_05735 [Pyrinomonadaceae bacterium]|nr:hypothetical protein [Pyrinomonadaceae bacterium]
MNRKPIRLIKRNARVPQPQAPLAPATSPNRWSTAVRSWVVEFQQRDRNEITPAFNSLFKDALAESGPTE